TLKCTLPETYPEAAPKIEFALKKGLSDRQESEICSLLDTQIEENRGMAMLYTISEVVREYLVENNREGNDGSEYQEMLRRMELKQKQEDHAAAQAQAILDESHAKNQTKSHEGTPVTVESFNEWKAKFDAEIQAKNAGKAEQIGTMTDIAVVAIEPSRVEEACCPVCMDSVSEPKNGVSGRRRQRIEYKDTDCWRLRCRHLYCVGCLTGWIQSKVNDRTVPIVCCNLECNREIRPSHVQAILAPTLFEKFSELVAIKSNEEYSMYCPNKTCSQMFLKPVDIRPEQEKSTCVWCKTKICLVCEVEWHQGFSCEQFKQILAEGGDTNEALLLNLKKNMNWKQCPKCKMLVERSSGCNFMRCTCGEHFCYECGSSYISRTPIPNNPHGRAACKCSLYPNQNNANNANNAILLQFGQPRPPPINQFGLNNPLLMAQDEGLRNRINNAMRMPMPMQFNNHIPMIYHRPEALAYPQIPNAVPRQQWNWNMAPPPVIPQYFPAHNHAIPRPKARAKKAIPHPLTPSTMNLRPRKSPEQTTKPKARIITSFIDKNPSPVKLDKSRELRIPFSVGAPLPKPQKQAVRLIDRKDPQDEELMVNLADISPPRLPRTAKPTPLLVKTKDELYAAAWLVEDSFLGITRPPPKKSPNAHFYYELHAYFASLTDLVICFLIALVFLQVPLWCNQEVHPCGDPSDPLTPMTFEIGYFSILQSRIIALLCLGYLLVDICFGYLYLENDFLARSERKIHLAMVLLSIVDITCALSFTAYTSVARLRLNEYARIIMFIVTRPELRRALRKIFRVLAEVRNILSLVIVFILFFSWMSVVLFQGTPEGEAQMPNIYEASWHFLILLTTANFPDIMMPAYNDNRLICLFFIFFLCFGLFFLMNVVLAVVFNNFARFSELEMQQGVNIRREKLDKAFDHLCCAAGTKDIVPMETCLRLFSELDRFHHISSIQRDKLTLLFDNLDTNGDHVLDRQEFLQVCDATERLLYSEHHERSDVEALCPRLYHSSSFQKLSCIVRHPRFEYAIDFVLVLNALAIFIESFSILNDAVTPNVVNWTSWTKWDALEMLFTTIYLMELVCKVLVYGIRTYWASIKNRFDCIITLAVVASDSFVFLPDTSLQVIKILLIARCLRLFRLIINIKGYRVICTTWLRLLHFGQHLLLLLFCVMYIYALLGNQLFGGLISPGRMHTEFPENAYTINDYMANNFNDMPGAMVLLFELILVNNWFVMADAHVAVTQTKWTRWYFIAYYVTGVTLLLNLVVASILDSFMDEYKHEHEPKDQEYHVMSAPEEDTPLVGDSDEEMLTTACWFIEDAFSGISRPHPVHSAFARQMHRVHAELHYLRGLAIVVLLSLTFIETPLWCHGEQPYPCGDPSDPFTPMTFDIVWLSDAQSHGIEAICLAFFLANSIIRYLYLQENFTNRKDSMAVLVLVVIAMGTLTISALFPTQMYSQSIQVYLRLAIFAVKNRNIRRTARKIFQVIAEIHNIISLVVVFVVFFAWVATMLFNSTEEGNSQMPNIYEACWNMLILLTTANFPDIMMLAYNKHRIVVIFFAFFLIFGLFFLMNVVLAVIYNNFSVNLEVDKKKKSHTREQKLQIAFRILCNIKSRYQRRSRLSRSYSTKELWDHRHDEWYLGAPSPQQSIPLDVCLRLFHEMNHYKNIGYIKKSKMRMVFDELDTDGDERLEWSEFSNICVVLRQALAKKRLPPSEVERWFPSIYHSDWFHSLSTVIKHPRFELTIDFVLVVNAFIVVLESLPVLTGEPMPLASEFTIWERIESIFSFIYLLEMLLKIIVQGRAVYWSSMKNRFDCVITLAVVSVDIWAYLPYDNPSRIMVKILLVARCLRLFRLIINVERYRVFCMTWLRLLPFGKNLLVIMFCALYFFSCLGHQLFGGLISPGRMGVECPTSMYTQNNYMANNFNDMASGMVLLFELLIVNNWFILADGFICVTSKYTRWFFITFHVTGVTILLNLFVASTLDAFVGEYEAEHQDQLGRPGKFSSMDNFQTITIEQDHHEPTTDFDKDERYMATSDICNELQNNPELGPDLERKICAAVLKQLDDKSNDVQSIAVKCLGILVTKVQEKQVGDICEKLCELIFTGKPELRDIYSIGLKTILSDVSQKTGASISTNLSSRLLKGVEFYSDQGIKSETLDILTELLKRFGGDFQSEHVAIMDQLLKELSDERAFVRKRVTTCLGALGVVASDALLHRLVEHLLHSVETNHEADKRTLIQTIGTLSRSVGHRLGRHLPVIVPLFLQFCGSPSNESMQNDNSNELRENCFQGLESFLLRCHAEITPHTTEILSVAMAFTKYDPNYMYDSGDEDMDEDMEDDEEYSEQEDNDYSDDDDASWKVRRAALRVMSAIITTRPELLDTLYASYSEPLIARFKEREESVRIDVFSVFSDLLRVTLVHLTPTSSGNPETGARPSFVRQRSCGSELHTRVGNIIAAANKQLGPKITVPTRCAAFGMLRELAQVEEGQLGPFLDTLMPNIFKALEDRNSSLKLDSLLFLKQLMATHQPQLFKKHMQSIVRLAVANASEDWYKIVAKSLALIGTIVNVLRPSVESPLADDLNQYVQPLFNAVLPRLKAYDIDQEIKDGAISSMGVLVSKLGDHLQHDNLNTVLPMILERMQNEITRIAAMKSLATIARSALPLDLSIILTDSIVCLSQLLRQQSRTLKQTALDTLIALIQSNGASLSHETLSDTIQETSALISDTDLQLSQLSLTLVSSILTSAPSTASDAAVVTKALPNALLLSSSALLHGPALEALFVLLRKLVAMESHGFESLFQALYSTDRPDASKHALHNVARCIAAISLQAEAILQKKAFETWVQSISSTNGTKHLALFCLGEFGRKTDIQVFGDIRGLILDNFSSQSEEVKHAAAFALGSICVGNMTSFLPTILDELKKNMHTYLLLSALKEVLGCKSPDLKAYVSTIVPVLHSHCEAEEEGVRNMVAECLGKLALVEPQTILPSVIAMCAPSVPVKTRWTAVTCLRFCMACGTNGAPMRELKVDPIVGALQDEDMGVRRAALITLNAAAHHQPAFLKPHVQKEIVPVLFQTMKIKMERTVDLGPFKHKVDDGLVLRKGAYSCIDTLLDTLPREVDANHFVEYLKLGLEDHDDVQMLCHQILVKLCNVEPGVVLSELEMLGAALDKTTNRRPKDAQVGSEVDRVNDVIRSALRAVDAVSCVRESDSNPKWKYLMDKIKKTDNLSTMLEGIKLERGVDA
ncbi:Cullin-associated NEDD8-dissociated protein, partial [Thraustotheca clavata]